MFSNVLSLFSSNFVNMHESSFHTAQSCAVVMMFFISARAGPVTHILERPPSVPAWCWTRLRLKQNKVPSISKSGTCLVLQSWHCSAVKLPPCWNSTICWTRELVCSHTHANSQAAIVNNLIKPEHWYMRPKTEIITILWVEFIAGIKKKPTVFLGKTLWGTTCSALISSDFLLALTKFTPHEEEGQIYISLRKFWPFI